ncbi:MAG: hypothetical protein LUB83_02310, partial [Prevotellaceae bacterium]|nr:hypothetical protein [Prevotellaceae bacterium]
SAPYTALILTCCKNTTFPYYLEREALKEFAQTLLKVSVSRPLSCSKTALKAYLCHYNSRKVEKQP